MSTSSTTIVIANNNKVGNDFWSRGVIEDDECVLNMFEEFSLEDTLQVLKSLKLEGNEDINIAINSIEIFKAINVFFEDKEVQVNTKDSEA